MTDGQFRRRRKVWEILSCTAPHYPTYSEIAAEVGGVSTSVIFSDIRFLAGCGYLRIDPGKGAITVLIPLIPQR